MEHTEIMAEEKNKRLLENFVSLGALQVVSYVLPLVSLPYLSRVLGVENFGLVFFAYAFMQYLIMLTDYGFGLSATREIATNRHNTKNLSNIFSAVTISKFVLLLLSYLILIMVTIFIPKIRENWLVFHLYFLMVVGNVMYPVWFFQGMERMKYITFLNILAKTLFLFLIFIFVKQSADYIIVPLLESLGFMISGLIGFYFAIKEFNIKFYIPSFSSIKKQLKYSTEFFLSRASVSLYTNTNSFCLGLISSNILVGYYVAAEKIYRAIGGLSYPLNNALYPFIAKNKDIKTYKKVTAIAIIVNTFICAVVFIFAPKFITIFYGAEMLNASAILRTFCFGAFIAVPHMMIGYPLLGAMGYTKEVNVSVIISSIVHVVGLLGLYLTNKMTIYTISYLAVFTEYFVFVLRAYWVWKYKLLTIKKEFCNA